MNKDDIIRMAREADLPILWITETGVIKWADLERFAALVEQHLIASGYRKCAENQKTTQHCALVEEAVKDEKEACAKLVGEFALKWWSTVRASNKHIETKRKAHDDFCALQAAFRARSET
jgi:hypothetical protein